MNTRIIFTVLLIISSLILQSCASILAEKIQDVSFLNNEKVNLTIDSINYGESTNFKTKLIKDFNIKQIKVEKEGYKTNYEIAIQNRRSDWYYMSIIPFGVLFYPMFADEFSKSRKYEDNYQLKNLSKYLIKNDSLKSIYIDDMMFDKKLENKIVCKLYNHVDYIDTNFIFDKNYRTDEYKMDFNDPAYYNKLNRVLINSKFIDTSNTVYVDNVNSLYIDCNVLAIDLNCVYRDINIYMFWKYPINDNYKKTMEEYALGMNLSYNQAVIKSVMSVKSVYGDTLLTDTLKIKSGKFTSQMFSLKTEVHKPIIDALEESLLKFLEKIKSLKILDLEPTNISFSDKIVISKPNKSPSNVKEALEASVSIKNKNKYGSGFVVSNDGYIITNYNVVARNNDIKVILNNGKEYKAKIVRYNKVIDLALLKIEENFDFAFTIPIDKNFSISKEVFAIGTPNNMDLNQTTTKGIISGIRKFQNRNILQTDIKTNYGNNGGPIISKDGQLVGVCEYKIVGKGVEGLSFSIPAVDIFSNLYLSY